MTQTPPPLERLKKRADFLAAAKGLASAKGAVLVQARDRRDGMDQVRVGFTATRRIGGAVVRNRAKRRLREAARAMLPGLARAGCDYVLIARGGTAERPWLRLLDDLKSALIRLAADLAAASGAGTTLSLPPSPEPLSARRPKGRPKAYPASDAKR
jgi:ribonuclease P protein component